MLKPTPSMSCISFAILYLPSNPTLSFLHTCYKVRGGIIGPSEIRLPHGRSDCRRARSLVPSHIHREFFKISNSLLLVFILLSHFVSQARSTSFQRKFREFHLILNRHYHMQTQLPPCLNTTTLQQHILVTITSFTKCR